MTKNPLFSSYNARIVSQVAWASYAEERETWNRRRVSGSDRFVFLRIVFDIDVNQETASRDEEIIRCEVKKCEIKYEIDLYAIINFSFLLYHDEFPLLHSDPILRTPRFDSWNEKTILGQPKRPIMSSLAKLPIEHTVATLSSGIGLYVIESISFVAVVKKGPAPATISREIHHSEICRSGNEERSNHHGWKDYRSGYREHPFLPHSHTFYENQNDRESLNIPRSGYSE